MMDHVRNILAVLVFIVAGTHSTGGQDTHSINEPAIRVAGAIIQVSENVDSNLAAIKRAIDFAKKEHADILLTPEGSLSGYTSTFDQDRVMEALAEVTGYAKKAGVGLALGVCLYEKGFEKPLNQIRFYDREGDFLGFHSKILRCTNMKNPQEGKEEVDLFACTELKTFSFMDLTIGGLVCNDLWATPDWTSMPDPFLVQELSGMGASLIFHATNTGGVPGEWGEVYRQFHDSNIRLRALTGKVWIVTTNAAPTNNGECLNKSGVVGPDGSWVVKAENTGEQFFVYTITLK